MLYTKEKCVTIRVTCTFTLNITSSEIAWSCMYSVLNSLSSYIKDSEENWNLKFLKHTFFLMKQNKGFFSITTPFPSIKKDPTYTQFHAKRFLELSLFVLRWRYSRSTLRCWQWKVMTLYRNRLFFIFGLQNAKKFLLTHFK